MPVFDVIRARWAASRNVTRNIVQYAIVAVALAAVAYVYSITPSIVDIARALHSLFNGREHAVNGFATLGLLTLIATQLVIALQTAHAGYRYDRNIDPQVTPGFRVAASCFGFLLLLSLPFALCLLPVECLLYFGPFGFLYVGCFAFISVGAYLMALCIPLAHVADAPPFTLNPVIGFSIAKSLVGLYFLLPGFCVYNLILWVGMTALDFQLSKVGDAFLLSRRQFYGRASESPRPPTA